MHPKDRSAYGLQLQPFVLCFGGIGRPSQVQLQPIPPFTAKHMFGHSILRNNKPPHLLGSTRNNKQKTTSVFRRNKNQPTSKSNTLLDARTMQPKAFCIRSTLLSCCFPCSISRQFILPNI